jgi:hypothetical protein
MTMKYSLAPGVHWVVNRFSLAITDARGEALTLDYPEAAIWDLFSRSYSYGKVVSMTAYIASLTPEMAAAVVRRSVDDWVARGLLEPSAGRVIPLKVI